MKNAKKLKWEGYSIKCNLQAAVTIHIKLTPRNLLISCVTNKDSSKTHTKNLRLFSYYSIHCLHKVIHFVRELSLGKYFSKISIKTKKYTHTDTQTLLNGAYPHTHTHTHTLLNGAYPDLFYTFSICCLAQFWALVSLKQVILFAQQNSTVSNLVSISVPQLGQRVLLKIKNKTL